MYPNCTAGPSSQSASGLLLSAQGTSPRPHSLAQVSSVHCVSSALVTLVLLWLWCLFLVLKSRVKHGQKGKRDPTSAFI